MTMGEKILRLRKARGWSQEELADRLGITRQAISRWESNSAKPDADKIVDICDLFGVSADYLLRGNYTGEDHMPVSPPEVNSDPPQRSGITAVQILGILLIISAVLLFCSIAIMSAIHPIEYVRSGIHFKGIRGYIMSYHLWWLVVLDIAALLCGILLLLKTELCKLCKWIRANLF